MLLVCAVQAIAFDSKAKQAVLVEVGEAVPLYGKEAEAPMPPSSMSKLMTVYLTFKRLKEGSLNLSDTLPVSEKAWRMGGSKMFVEVGKDIPVEDLLQGVIVQSGNDACIVLAEGLAGSEEAFAREMTIVGQEIGLKNSHFANATGWPDPEHYMTAEDLATLATRLIEDFPDYYHYFAEESFTWHGITQRNRNGLLGKVGIDGLKTGHTEAAGYGVVISAEENGRRLIAVVNGLASERERLEEAEKLIRYGFHEFRPVTLFEAGQVVTESDVWFGKKRKVPLVAKEPVKFLLPWLQRKALNVSVEYTTPLPAPLQQGQVVGMLKVSVPGQESPRQYPLVTGQDVQALNPVARILPALEYYFITQPVQIHQEQSRRDAATTVASE